MKLTNNPIYHAQLKHIETQHHFVRENIQSKEIDLMYFNTNENMVDIFTNPLKTTNFVICNMQKFILLHIKNSYEAPYMPLLGVISYIFNPIYAPFGS
jgi:hypothetical protein